MNKLLLGTLLATSLSVNAATPMWTFTPLTPTTATISAGEQLVIQYLVTNQAKSTKSLSMNPIQGVTQTVANGACANPFNLGAGQACKLDLLVVGSQLSGNIVGGPVVCNSAFQCYQPSQANSLNIIKK